LRSGCECAQHPSSPSNAGIQNTLGVVSFHQEFGQPRPILGDTCQSSRQHKSPPNLTLVGCAVHLRVEKDGFFQRVHAHQGRHTDSFGIGDLPEMRHVMIQKLVSHTRAGIKDIHIARHQGLPIFGPLHVRILVGEQNLRMRRQLARQLVHKGMKLRLGLRTQGRFGDAPHIIVIRCIAELVAKPKTLIENLHVVSISLRARRFVFGSRSTEQYLSATAPENGSI